ncbi:uncharacterized protein GGS22DRAFT_118239 [Annulohypoxylon maeteangense]|uniref:uncharacterized protein n=1 Tax=Annulohypoxylon maeteangense TaxID=1927788 RepID=UPI0020087815|nr:uncharacterized protein GGS22DRAFT_118239 [Annulohypoxylon maeteangense]KAI0886830.1 hypothetical protein GGS22DRAFT_118239 [Annulohypoxylon maeteangense]
MASPAIALPNGVSTPVQLTNNNVNLNAASNSPNANNMIDVDIDTAQSMSGTSIKRKRESTDASEKPPNGLNISPISPIPTDTVPSPSLSNTAKVDKPTIRNYYDVLQSIDPMPSVLKRPLPDPEDSSNEPQAKRKKPDDGNPLPSIADKVAQEQYGDLDSIIIDIKASISDNLAELRHVEPGKDSKANDEAIAKVIDFKRQAYGIFKREMSYPDNTRASGVLEELNSISDLQSNASGNMILVVNGEQMRGKPLYSSLQQSTPTLDGTETEVVIRPLRESGLPNGVKTGRAIPYSFSSPIEKDKKAKTLGELFPAPRNLLSLQPPKAPKSTVKGVQVGWHHPELTEKSKYRAGSYFSQNITTGRWLDYSNAAPPSQIMTKQRERALSLAGNKPSSSDLEMSEMESLFRGAFSSFAPSKDDSAAMISSGMISQTMWWQKVGQRSFDRLVETELLDAAKDADKADIVLVEEVDETLIKEALDNWDETMVDPSLEQVCGPKKSQEEMDADDVLQEVSDMIQTLVSYQKNRNLTLPSASSQSRYAADPAHSDMLTNGTPVQPGEEELATYQALKAQLALVVQSLPPYAVARLNSDKLDELNISTKIEVRTDEYQGLMEEDEVAARARAAQAPVPNPRPVTHRASSSSSTMQYGQPYHANRAPMPNAQFYGAQTPVRATQPPMRGPPQTMPPVAYPPRPPSNTGYRPPNQYPGTAYSTQFSKPPAPYSQPGSYGNTPTQVRPPYQPMPGYPNMNTPTPQARFPSYPPNTQPPPNYHHSQPFQAQPHQLQGTPSHQPYNQYTNGAASMPQRTASPHVSHQTPQPHHQPLPHHPGYNPTGTPVRQASYGGQPNMNNDPSRRFYPNAGSPVMPNNQMGQHNQQSQNPQTPGTSSFHTSLQPHQVQQAMDQAKARFDATKSAQRTNEGIRNSMSGQGQGQVGAPVGLGGIGLGGDPARLAAARANMPTYPATSQGPSQSPKPQLNSPRVTAAPSGINGTPTPMPTSNGGSTIPNREA